MVGSWSDITERKRAEEAAAAARDRVEHLLAKSPAVIDSFKATGDYAPTFISRNVKDLLGYDPEEYLESPDSGAVVCTPGTGSASRTSMDGCSKGDPPSNTASARRTAIIAG